MHIKIKILLTAITVAIISTVSVDAQKVKVENGKAIIDASGLPNTNMVKKARTTNATNSTTVPVDDINDLASKKSNETLYQKFEVSKTDNSTSINWMDGVNTACSGTINGTTGWRLPTQRELQLIWILHSRLKALDPSIFTPLSLNYYWSATLVEGNRYYSYYLRTINNLFMSSSNPKTNNYYVRCIRELD